MINRENLAKSIVAKEQIELGEIITEKLVEPWNRNTTE